MMKIIIFGATGDVGSRLVNEALAHGHHVTAVVRQSSQIGKLPAQAHSVVNNLTNSLDIDAAVAGHDLIISAIRPPEGHEQDLVPLTKMILTAAENTATHAFIVGGAASLKLSEDDETTVLTAPNFLPASVVDIATACAAQHQACIENTHASWTYFSPPAILAAGTRSGKYRSGTDVLIYDSEGESKISMEDFAVFMLDEASVLEHASALSKNHYDNNGGFVESSYVNNRRRLTAAY